MQRSIDGGVEIRTVSSGRDLRRSVDFAYTLYTRAAIPSGWRHCAGRRATPSTSDRTPSTRRRRETCSSLIGKERSSGGSRPSRPAHNRFYDDRMGFRGFFECVDDQRVADALFAAAAVWLSEQGLTGLRGPVNPSTNYECGLLVEGFDQRPSFMTAWNPPYYDRLCTAGGLVKAKDLLAFWFDGETTEYALPDFVARQA